MAAKAEVRQELRQVATLLEAALRRVGSTSYSIEVYEATGEVVVHFKSTAMVVKVVGRRHPLPPARLLMIRRRLGNISELIGKRVSRAIILARRLTIGAKIMAATEQRRGVVFFENVTATIKHIVSAIWSAISDFISMLVERGRVSIARFWARLQAAIEKLARSLYGVNPEPIDPAHPG